MCLVFPQGEFHPKLAANLTLAYVNANVAVGSLEVLDTANLLTLQLGYVNHTASLHQDTWMAQHFPRPPSPVITITVNYCDTQDMEDTWRYYQTQKIYELQSNSHPLPVGTNLKFQHMKVDFHQTTILGKVVQRIEKKTPLRKRLGPCERKEMMARVVQVCKELDWCLKSGELIGDLFRSWILGVIWNPLKSILWSYDFRSPRPIGKHECLRINGGFLDWRLVAYCDSTGLLRMFVVKVGMISVRWNQQNKTLCAKKLLFFLRRMRSHCLMWHSWRPRQVAKQNYTVMNDDFLWSLRLGTLFGDVAWIFHGFP